MTSPFTSTRWVNLQKINAQTSAVRNSADNERTNQAGKPASNNAFPFQ